MGKEYFTCSEFRGHALLYSKGMKTLLITLCLILQLLPAYAMEKLNQGDYSILATELSRDKTVSIYLLPFADLNADEFSLSFIFFKDGRNLIATVDKNQALKAEKIYGRVSVNDISGSTFVMEGPVLRFEYDLKSLPDVWTLLTQEKKGRLSFKHLINSNAYLDRYYYRFDPVSSLKSLSLDTLKNLNQLSPKTVKMPISMVMTSVFDMNNSHHIEFFLKRLKDEVDTYWQKQCNIELEFKSIRSFTPNERDPVAFIPDLNPEYFVMESWFHQGEKSIPVVSGKSAIGAEGMAFMKPFWNIRNVNEMMSRVQNPNMVIFTHGEANKKDANTLAHELGHVLLQTGHSDDARNLMSRGGIGTKELPRAITKKECEVATAFLKANFN